MKHVDPRNFVISVEDRARAGFNRVAYYFGREAAINAALSPELSIDDGRKCFVALASGTGSYWFGCKLMGLAPDSPQAVALGFWMSVDPYDTECAEVSAYYREAEALRRAFRDAVFG